MVIDIGGGTTEVAVISLGGMVVWESIRVGGYEMDDAIVDYVKNMHKLLIGQETAEAAKIEIGSVSPTTTAAETTVAGRDLVTGLLRRVTVSGADLRRALEAPVGRIVAAVKDTLERTPPELAADLGERGIVLAGGGSLLRGLDEKLRDEVGLPGAARRLAADLRGRGRRPQPRRARDARPGREGPAQEPLAALAAGQEREQPLDRTGPHRRRRGEEAGEPLGLRFLQRDRRLGDAVGVPDAEADVRLLGQVARDAQRLAGVARMRRGRTRPACAAEATRTRGRSGTPPRAPLRTPRTRACCLLVPERGIFAEGAQVSPAPGPLEGCPPQEEPAMPPLRVLIADDHQLFAETPA